MFEKLADFILKHSKAIIALWIVVLVCALPLGIKSGDVMEYDLTSMVGSDSESGTGQKIMDDYYVNSVNMSEIVVVEYDSADSTLTEANAQTFLADFNTKLTEKYDSTLSATVVGSYSKEGHTTGVILAAITSTDEDFDILDETGAIRSLLSDSREDTGYDFTTYVTGNDALTYDTMSSSSEDMAKIDPISVFLILILLGLFFFSFCTAVVPPLGVGLAYGISLFVMYALGNVMGIYYLTQTLVLVTMLGAGCDYGIFIITRYREELKKGADHESALKTAIEWAGESVFTSGLAVIIGFGALAICDFTMVRTMGIVLACGIVLALVVALTLIPSVVNLLGGKIFWPTKVETYQAIQNGEGTGIYAKFCDLSKRYFEFVARFTRKYAVPIVVVALLICVPTLYVYVTSDDSYDMISIEPESESKDGLNAIMEETYGGSLMPTYVVMELNSPAIAAMGVATVGTTNMPYLIWTSDALTITASGATGYVPALMQLSNSIATEHSDIVATSNSLTSWYALYYTVAQKLGTTDANTINHAIYSQLGDISTSVQEGVGKVLTATSYALHSTTDWVVTPDEALGTICIYNVMDNILNVQTGLINVDPEDEGALEGTSTYVQATSDTTTGTYASIMLITSERPMSDNTMALIDDLHDEFHDSDGYDDQYSAVFSDSYVAGTSAAMDDISTTVSAQFKVIELVVVVLLVVLLFFILKCYITPIRAILNILMSVIWTLALTHFVFEDLMNVPVCWIVPIVLFVVLLGLGMDYDIFMTTRVREYKLKGYSNHDAVEMAVKNAGSTITLCAFIMGGTFLSLLVANSSMMQEFGFALGVGILIDGLFMVTYVVPSLMHILGEASWKGPASLQKRTKKVEQENVQESE